MNGPTFWVFAGDRRVGHGLLAAAVAGAKDYLDGGGRDNVLFFEEESGRQVDFDLRGSLEDVVARHGPAPASRGPGRPRLGVVAREVTLLPRHWEWLEEQPNGASAALRRLVEEARKRDPAEQQARRAREAMHRFATAMAGDRPGYEDAARALFAAERETYLALVAAWPADIVAFLRARAAEAFPSEPRPAPAG
ncbi:MAG: DUF2239 family protein [Planctomycetota bacterium]